MRIVVSSSEVPHLWAHASQSEARNSQGNLFFDGAIIYSYRRTWPLAQIFKKRGGPDLVLCNSSHASNTTARHQSAVNQAISHLASMSVPHVASLTAEAHAANLQHLANVAASALKSAQRALRADNAQWRQNEARMAIDNAGSYIKFFGLRRKAPEFPAADWAAVHARLNRLAVPDPASADKRERARAKRAHLLQVHADAVRNDWRLGGAWGASRYNIGGPVMLRVDGDEIVTSQGARIPLDHAPRIWRAVCAVVSRGVPYERNGHTEHAGNYAIDRIAPDGTLTAGCHTIPHAELRAVARQIGLAA